MHTNICILFISLFYVIKGDAVTDLSILASGFPGRIEKEFVAELVSVVYTQSQTSDANNEVSIRNF
ncbi:hypothetical protein EON65_45205 [archaeon]|nr:MAG: hypothetical protein EON65_45205 [archaeon]